MRVLPYFSIVVPAFNREIEVCRAIDSCLAQSFPDFEVVVVDDGSTDQTAEAVSRVADPRVRLIRHPRNRGVCPARNTAVLASGGDWIVFLDSDHQFLPGALARMFQVIGDDCEAFDRFGFMYEFDDGRMSPSPLPAGGEADYAGWLAWINRAQLTDALWATRRACFDRCLLPESFALEFSYGLDFAKHFRTRFFAETLALQHTNSPGRLSCSGPQSDRGLLKRQALDQVADWRRVLSEHGRALEEFAPKRYRAVLRRLSVSHVLAGQKWEGIRAGLEYLRTSPASAGAWAAVALAVAGSNFTRWVMNARVSRRKAGAALREMEEA